MSKGPLIYIPQRHQAAPNQGHIYTPGQISQFKPQALLTETEMSHGFEVGSSSIHGYGLFATKDFQAHDLIWHERLKGKNANPQNGGPLRWTNHSDRPNGALLLSLDEMLEVSLVATSDIRSGQEITYNYNVFGHTGYKAACNCQNDNCQGSFVLRTEWGEKK